MTVQPKKDDEITVLLNYIVQVIATKNLIGVRPDDPVMVLPSIMKVMVDDFAQSYTRILEQHTIKHEEIALRWRMDAKEVSERIMNAALDAVRRQMVVSAAEASKLIREAIKDEFDTALLELRREKEDSRKVYGPAAVASAALAFLGGVAALAAVALKLI